MDWYRRRMGCYSLYICCKGAMWDVTFYMWAATASMWAFTVAMWAVTVSMWVVTVALWVVTSSMWAVTSSMHALKTLYGLLLIICGLLQPLCGMLQALCGLKRGCSEFLRKKRDNYGEKDEESRSRRSVGLEKKIKKREKTLPSLRFCEKVEKKFTRLPSTVYPVS